MLENQKVPVVFISYSWDDEAHKEWVLQLAYRLLSNGIDVLLDRFMLHSGTNFTSIIEEGLTKADKVIIVASPNYKTKAEFNKGGVGHEYSIIHAELYNHEGHTSRFIPVLRRGIVSESIPKYLGQILHVDFTDDSQFEKKYIELCRGILGLADISKPAIGSMPDWVRENSTLYGAGGIRNMRNSEVADAIEKPTLGILYPPAGDHIPNEEEKQKSIVSETPINPRILSHAGSLDSTSWLVNGLNHINRALRGNKRLIAVSLFIFVFIFLAFELVNKPIAPLVSVPTFKPEVDNPSIRLEADLKFDRNNFDVAASKYLRYVHFLNSTEQRHLGHLYFEGLGLKKNVDSAIIWFENAANNGNDTGMYELGSLYEQSDSAHQDFIKALKWYRNAADKGNICAMRSIGYLFSSGRGVKKDYKQAKDWFQKAATNGDAEAMSSIAVLFDQGGFGLEQNYEQAFVWFRKATENGDPYAAYSLGLYYKDGLGGVIPDSNEAKKWFRVAVARGYGKASQELGKMQ